MELQTIINFAVLIVGLGIGLLLNPIRVAIKELQENQKELTDKMEQIKLLVVGDYVKNAELEKALDKMSSTICHRFDKIDAKLDEKLDKKP